MTEQELLQQIDSFIAANGKPLLEDLAALVAAPSVRGEAQPGAPFGPGPRQALDTALAIARRMGLAAYDDEGYLGWAELPGRQPEHLATVTHLDVVPVGEGWSGDPYVLRQQDGWLLGRGVVDDKGPSILCLYMAKFLQEYTQSTGRPLRYGLRVLLGCSEESGMEDLPHYFQSQPQPLFAFSPDADFPVCHGEKGILGGDFVSAPLGSGKLAAFVGGEAGNVIPDRAHCIVQADPSLLPSTDAVTVTSFEGMARLDAQGISGHAAMPAGTCNAIGLLVNYLLEHKLCSAEETRFLTLLQRLHGATDGSGLGVACQDGVFDPLTLIGGVIRLEDGVLRQNINIRFPTAITGEKLTAALQAVAAEYGASFGDVSSEEPFYIPADSLPIQTLLQSYNEVSGRNDKPFTMGGGTYARHFTNAVSFGPEMPGEQLPPFGGPIHGPNEAANKETLVTALKIYILAMWRLQQLDF